MSPIQRQRPDQAGSGLVRRAEPIRTGPADEPPAPERPVAPRRPSRPARDDASRPSPSDGPAAGSGELAAAPDGRRPAARELAAPARRVVAREALKADVPADLALLQRLRRYRLDKGVDIRDQVAIAVDEWLTGQGY